MIIKSLVTQRITKQNERKLVALVKYMDLLYKLQEIRRSVERKIIYTVAFYWCETWSTTLRGKRKLQEL
jgi:hypothetical protein